MGGVDAARLRVDVDGRPTVLVTQGNLQRGHGLGLHGVVHEMPSLFHLLCQLHRLRVVFWCALDLLDHYLVPEQKNATPVRVWRVARRLCRNRRETPGDVACCLVLF